MLGSVSDLCLGERLAQKRVICHTHPRGLGWIFAKKKKNSVFLLSQKHIVTTWQEVTGIPKKAAVLQVGQSANPAHTVAVGMANRGKKRQPRRRTRN